MNVGGEVGKDVILKGDEDGNREKSERAVIGGL